jgi:glycosyltransferase involved in cell wall biosynthesis
VSAAVGIDVVVCTYDNAASLERVLGALAGQAVTAGVDWEVLVVDNNCTDATPALLARLQAEGVLRLRVVREEEQGLTPARRRGVAETGREWIAFIDDDCLVAPDWVERAAAAAREHPGAGALGGLVELEWEREPPPHVLARGWAFAQQDHGPEPVTVGCLAGAGMVVRRAALERSGWTRQPLLADRVGRRLVSGGDVEIALRLAAEHELWYDPRLRLRHSIPAGRTADAYPSRLTYGLGTSKLLGDSMLWPGTYPRWILRSLREALPFAREAAVATRHRQRADARLAFAFLRGWHAGIWRLLRADRHWRAALLGSAAPVRPG